MFDRLYYEIMFWGVFVIFTSSGFVAAFCPSLLKWRHFSDPPSRWAEWLCLRPAGTAFLLMMGYLLHYRFVQGESLRSRRSGLLNPQLGEPAKIGFTVCMLLLIGFLWWSIWNGYKKRRVRLEIQRIEERKRERELAAQAEKNPWDTTNRDV